MPLNSEQIQQVSYTLSSQGWSEVMLPALIERGRHAVKALVLTGSERSRVYGGTDLDTDDHVLRAIIRDIEWMSTKWANELMVSEHNRLRDELDQANGIGVANQP